MIVSFAGAALTLLLIFELGLLALLVVGHECTRASIFGLAASMGVGILGTFLFWLSLAGYVPSRDLQLGLLALGAIPLWLSRRRLRFTTEPIEFAGWDKPIFWTAASITVLCAVAVVLSTLATDIYMWDGFAIWGLKARVLAIEPLSRRPAFFYEPSLSFSHLDYPLLAPLVMAAFYSASGSFHDPSAKLLFALVYVALLSLVYSGLSRLASRVVAAVMTAVLASAPTIVYWAGSGYADIVVALYAGGAAVYFSLYLRDGRRSDAIIALLLTVFLAFSKNEGRAIASAYAVIALGFQLARRHRNELRFLLPAMAVAAAVVLPYLLWAAGVPKTHEDYGRRLTDLISESQFARIPQVMEALVLEPLNAFHWGALWYLPLAAILIRWRNLFHPAPFFLLVATGVQLMIYTAAYAVSPYEPADLLPVTLDRLLLQTAPLVLALAAAMLATPPIPTLVAPSQPQLHKERR